MEIILAQASDGERLKEFFNKAIIPGPIDLRIDRPKSFFDQNNLQSKDHRTLILRDTKDGSIHGLATVLFRSGIISGKPELIGYCTDLRLSPSRNAFTAWARQFLPALEKLKKERTVHHLFSVVAQSEDKRFNSLFRSRSGGQYFLLSPFEIVAVLGKTPFREKPLETVILSRAAPDDLEPLAIYLASKVGSRPMAFPYTVDLLKSRIETWPGLSLNDFLIARDRRGNIIGSATTWNNTAVQTITPMRYNGFSSTLKTALKVGSLFKLSHQLPDPGTRFDLVFLTNLYADNPDIFFSLLYSIYESTEFRRVPVYSHFPKMPVTAPPKGFICARLPFALYTLLGPGEILDDSLREARLKVAPELDAALI